MGYRENAAPSLLRDKLIEAIDQADQHMIALRKCVEAPKCDPSDAYGFANEMTHRRAALEEACRHKEALLEKLREAGF